MLFDYIWDQNRHSAPQDMTIYKGKYPHVIRHDSIKCFQANGSITLGPHYRGDDIIARFCFFLRLEVLGRIITHNRGLYIYTPVQELSISSASFILENSIFPSRKKMGKEFFLEIFYALSERGDKWLLFLLKPGAIKCKCGRPIACMRFDVTRAAAVLCLLGLVYLLYIIYFYIENSSTKRNLTPFRRFWIDANPNDVF